MKLKKNFVLRDVADVWAVLPTAADTLNFDGMLTLNDSGAMLWKALETGSDKEQLVEVLTSEYEVGREQASADVDAFLNTLSEAG
ncbi:MAG: PqqD family protein, partial [Firmicutes bacterium]|nr:PqqD family protein [Bacillota bacterium]